MTPELGRLGDSRVEPQDEVPIGVEIGAAEDVASGFELREMPAIEVLRLVSTVLGTLHRPIRDMSFCIRKRASSEYEQFDYKGLGLHQKLLRLGSPV